MPRNWPGLPRVVTAAVIALTVVAGSIAPAAATKHDPAARRKGVQQERARKAAEIDVLKASDDDLERALDAIDANVRRAQANAASARQAADAASARLAQARASEQRTEQQLAELRERVKQFAVRAYMRGGTGSLAGALEARSVADAANREALVKFTLDKDSDAADQLKVVREDLTAQRAAAEQAAEQAEARRREASARLGEAQGAQDEKQRVADAVEERLERALAEAEGLATLDKQLSEEIARRQAALARKAGPARASRSAPRQVGAVSLTTVRGIVVATEIADRVEAMLAAAEADGFVLRGGGYRDREAQIEARRRNCGTSDYDVYEKPASECDPDTARPGYSMHERGLAIDFTWNGALITSRSSRAFQWLDRNAIRFGFYNLPSEPWHWSVNGQ